MRLIRLMSDLPNVIFLLAFDGDRVARSLDDDPAEGRNYLEKIVQQTYDIPSIRQDILGSFLTHSMNSLFNANRDHSIRWYGPAYSTKSSSRSCVT